MLAVEATRFGGPEVLAAREVPDPVPGAGQVLVAVSSADVLFVEAQVRSGWGREYFPVEPPYVPGDGVAGTVVAVGDDVDRGWLDRRVVGYTGSEGGYAERAVVGLDMLVPVPDGVSLADAAALSHDGPMALTLLDAAGPARRVLVLGANGGAGILLVRRAKEAGGYVVGTARGPRKADQVRRAAGGGVDVVFDGVGGRPGTDALDLVSTGGRFFAYGAPTGNGFAAVDAERERRRGVEVVGLDTLARARTQMRSLAAQAFTDVLEGRLAATIGATYPLAKAADAHAALEARTVLGKILLEP